ncbi:MAG: hypothetical protein Q9198_003918 [Flavoplaca austrocitrina]
MSLVYKWDILKKVTHEKEGESTERKEARADLTKVLDFVQSSKGLDAYFKNRESHQSSQVIEFEYLWTIFSTGTEVIALTFMEEKQVMIRIFRIDRYYGTKKINTLPCYPLDSHKKDTSSTGLEDLKVKYTLRGERFKDLCQAKPGVKQMFHYDGQGLIVESKQNNNDNAFRVDEVKEAKKAKEAIFDKELQLELKVKNMITALVTQHNSQEGGKGVQNPDLIEGKGRGLVIMLHGPPGVGKTLTAEAIAEKTSRPLLIVSVAQIGLNASKAERNLERLFELASRWEAVLLVDEADVFLETRDTQVNPNRNALVSAVRFDELTQPQMQSILRTILRKFNVKDSEIEDITDNFQNYLADSPRFKLNGREIRNVVFSAHAVALSEGKESIGWNHIRDVLRLTRDFQDQLKAITDKQRYGREAAKGAE